MASPVILLWDAGGPPVLWMRLSRWVIPMLLFALAANLAAVAYVRGERTLYYWDQVNYWAKAADLAGMIRAGEAAGAVAKAIQSPRHEEYNSLPALPPAFVLALLGGSRLVYILAVVNLYVIPAAAAMMLLAIRLGPRPAAGWIVLLVIGLNPLFWAPVFLGYVDVAGLVFLSFIILLTARNRVAGWKEAIFLGLSLAAVVLFRRWYAYWCACFGLVMLVDCLIALHRAGTGRRKIVWADIRGLCLAAAVTAATILLLCGPSGVRQFFVNHHHQFAAWRPADGGLWASLVESIRATIFHQGWPLAVLGLAGCLWAIRNPSTRRPAIILLTTSALAIVPFSRIHPLGAAPHHFYLVLPPLLLWPAVMLASCISRRRATGAVLLGVAILYGTVNFASAFTHRPPLLPASMLAESKFPPAARHDRDRVIEMMEAIPAADAGDNDIYVAASSRFLSASHLSMLMLSLGPGFAREIPACRQVIHPAELDMRDGFPHRLLTSRYVIVATPSQYHVRPDHQAVVDVVARCFLEGRSVTRSFRRFGGEYRLDGGARAFLYQRIRPIEPRDAAELRRLLHEAHPRAFAAAP